MWVIRPSSFRCNLIGRGFMSQVSWIRRRDSHILTIDWLLFIADDRFRIFLVEPTCTWTLQIKYVQPRDAGIYECQINTSPKMSHLVQLNVVGKCIYFYFFFKLFSTLRSIYEKIEYRWSHIKNTVSYYHSVCNNSFSFKRYERNE